MNVKNDANITHGCVKTEAFTMRYFSFGRGERPLVILPGLSVQSVMGSAQAVAKEYSVMQEEFTVYLFDRREDLPSKYSVYDMAQDTAAAIQTLGLRDVCLFGASQGGMIALCIAINHPELVGKLALGSTSPDADAADSGVLGRWITLAKNGDRLGLYTEFGRAIYPQAVFEMLRGALAAASETVTDGELARFVILAEGTAGFHVSDRLTELKCPVLVLGAADDRVLGEDATGKFIEKLGDRPDFGYYVYDGFGHAAFDTAPDYRNRLYDFFIN